MTPPAKPTPKQRSYLRQLAERTGQTFTPPSTRAEASQEIKRLLRIQATPPSDRRRERRQLDQDLQTQRGGASKVRSDEVAGYGANAHWA